MNQETFDKLNRRFWYGAVVVSSVLTTWYAYMAFTR